MGIVHRLHTDPGSFSLPVRILFGSLALAAAVLAGLVFAFCEVMASLVWWVGAAWRWLLGRPAAYRHDREYP